jgi:hypothetical protein
VESPAPLAAAAQGRHLLVFRPLVETEQREVALYSRLRALGGTSGIGSRLRVAARASPFASIEQAAGGLLAGLQAAFPATVHNVVRTALKLRAPEGALLLCSLCLSIRPPAESEAGFCGACRAIIQAFPGLARDPLLLCLKCQL